MQTIKHIPGYANIHWLLNDIERLYVYLSDESHPMSKQLFGTEFDSSLKPIFELFTNYSFREFKEPQFIEKPASPIVLPKYNPKNIIVCYSGGKDSFSVVRHYQKLGYNVYPYHIRGLNKAYYDEYKVADAAMEKLGLKVYTDSVGYGGQHVWIEHPMKNMLLANMALAYGINNNIGTKIAFGNFRTSSVADVSFDVCGGDCMEMWRAYENVVSRIIPKFRIYTPNLNFQTALYALAKEPEYLPYTISCITPNRFRNQFRERTLSKFPVDLLPNRCGCCWKCASEYIWYCDHGIFELHKDYYIHCLEVLLHTLEQEVGYRIHTLDYVWEQYFFYPMNKSKIHKELENATIRSGKIKSAGNSTKR